MLLLVLVEIEEITFSMVVTIDSMVIVYVLKEVNNVTITISKFLLKNFMIKLGLASLLFKVILYCRYC